jgi:NAD(P)-dependent dehydrogenase (short-subunit alcohol dehydrogenase family)
MRLGLGERRVIDLADRKVLVVGASSGVGRDVAEVLAARGAHVAFAARRQDIVEAAAQKAGGGCVGFACDVRDEESCASVVARTIDAFGGLDTIVYAAAIGPLAHLAEASAETWREVLDINLIGAALVTKAAISSLEASGHGRAIYLSSVAGSTSTPWPGLGLYAVSKAGLERMVDSWRLEHRGVRFSSVVLGPIMSRSEAQSTFSAGWDMAKAGTSIEEWTTLGLMNGDMIDSADLGDQVVAILTTSASFSRVVLEP